MPDDFSSSNPFRRKRQSYIAQDARPSDEPRVLDPTPQSPLPSSSVTDLPADALKKAEKKVRVLSPPPLSPPIAPASSTSVPQDEADADVHHHPVSLPQAENPDDPFENASTDDSEDEEESPVRAAPPNPFSKTLETMERSAKETSVHHSPPTAPNITQRQSMDVDAFKRLLMTGNAGLPASSTAPPPNPAHSAHPGLGDGGSSTDASSLYRQSLSEPIHGAHQHQETPRTSQEISESDDDPRAPPVPAPAKQKPPPPHSRHGKLIKVELKDGPVPKPLGSPLTLGPGLPQINLSASSPIVSQSSSDFNKPLPPAPVRTPGEADAESIFDKEAAGKVPEPSSPAPSIKAEKKTPPAPPLARRHSQMVSSTKTPRSEATRMALKQADEDPLSVTPPDHGRPSSGSDRAPPPPPSRRMGSVRLSSHQGTLQSSPSLVQPSPPPSRASSFRIRRDSGRPASVIGIDAISAPKRSSVGPPPPPPPRHSRNSVDGGSRSADPARRSIESVRQESGSSIAIPQVANSPPEIGTPSANGGGHDIMADLSALQRDIDALMLRSERQRVS
ncbi:hypothetical protein F5884DRAFT_25201 [Xylogone sp. PMI_703]|nr:hypothetical protein F5884DRAFT_25201 [Xylogone sp. PMI_703]